MKFTRLPRGNRSGGKTTDRDGLREYYVSVVDKDYTRNGDINCLLYDVQEDTCFYARAAGLMRGLSTVPDVEKMRRARERAFNPEPAAAVEEPVAEEAAEDFSDPSPSRTKTKPTTRTRKRSVVSSKVRPNKSQRLQADLSETKAQLAQATERAEAAERLAAERLTAERPSGDLPNQSILEKATVQHKMTF